MSVWQVHRGQDRAIAHLQRAIARDRVPHAYLFSGPPGAPLVDLALALAAALSCQRARGAGCVPDDDACPACAKIASGIHPDVVTLVREGAAQIVPIDLDWLRARGWEQAIRKHLRGNLRWDRRSYDVIGYWRVDAERWTQAYVERGAELFAVYRQALDDGTAMRMQLSQNLLACCRDALVHADQGHQCLELVHALGHGEPELGGQAAQGVRQHGHLLDQQRPGRMQSQHRLLLHALDRHKARLGTGTGHAQGGGVCGVVLLTLLDERPDGFGSDQFYLVAKAAQQPTPVVTSTTGFEEHPAWRLLLESARRTCTFTFGYSLRYCSMCRNR